MKIVICPQPQCITLTKLLTFLECHKKMAHTSSPAEARREAALSDSTVEILTNNCQVLHFIIFTYLQVKRLAHYHRKFIRAIYLRLKHDMPERYPARELLIRSGLALHACFLSYNLNASETSLPTA